MYLGAGLILCLNHTNWGPNGGGLIDLGITLKFSVFFGALLTKGELNKVLKHFLVEI